MDSIRFRALFETTFPCKIINTCRVIGSISNKPSRLAPLQTRSKERVKKKVLRYKFLWGPDWFWPTFFNVGGALNSQNKREMYRLLIQRSCGKVYAVSYRMISCKFLLPIFNVNFDHLCTAGRCYIIDFFYLFCQQQQPTLHLTNSFITF